MNWIWYGSLAVLLFGAEQLYLWLAIRFNIVDRPNYRSAHSQLTVRGGGIIFWLAALAAFFINDAADPFFFAGLTLVALVSLADDVVSVSNRFRFGIQLISVSLLLHQTGLWSAIGWWIVPAWVVACGVLNAYNFMDGINGMTAFYSLVTVFTLLLINQLAEPFTTLVLPMSVLISTLVFSFFNARRTARCFAGDVGSVSMAFIVVFLLLLLLCESGQLAYCLLLTVYGIDSVMTILYRLWRGENIFQAHKLHLFQLLVHRRKWPHLRVAGLYALVQALINGLVIWLVRQDVPTQWLGSLTLLAGLTVFYWQIKKRLLVFSKPVLADL